MNSVWDALNSYEEFLDFLKGDDEEDIVPYDCMKGFHEWHTYPGFRQMYTDCKKCGIKLEDYKKHGGIVIF